MDHCIVETPHTSAGSVYRRREAPPIGRCWVRTDPALDGIETRPIEARDLPFLAEVYAAARAEELASVGWDGESRRAFLLQQFIAQHRHYQEHYVDAEFLLLLLHGEPIGRLYWQAHARAATLIDISLLPSARGRGIGSAVLRLLCASADRFDQVIGLRVEPDNRARGLYLRHGFEELAASSVPLKMQRLPRECRQ